MNNLEKIIILQEDYIKLLGEEINGLMGLAISHGWTSTKYEEAKRIRKEIQDLKDQEKSNDRELPIVPPEDRTKIQEGKDE